MTKEELKMTNKEALMLLLKAFLGDEISKRKVNKNYDEIENQLLTDIYRLEKLEQENQELKGKVNHFKKVIEVMQNPSKLDCTHMFDNCKLTSLPELPELENELEKLKNDK